MAVVAHQEESPDDVLIWRYAASRAHAAAEEARARAQQAMASAERTDRRLMKAVAPQVQRFVRSVRIQRRASRTPAAAEPKAPALEVIQGGPGLWTPREWTPRLEQRSGFLRVEEQPWALAPRTASFDDILLDAASVPLPAALLVYDDVLEWLQRLHARGQTYGNVRASAVEVDQEGRCVLRDGDVEFAEATVRTRLDDLQAATWIFVAATGGAHVVTTSPALDPSLLEALPLPARCLVEQTLAVEAAYRLTAARLRSDLGVAARAFLPEDWERGARAWLASAAAASGVELTGHPQAADGAAGASTVGGGEQARRGPLLGGATRRDPRFMVGLGIAASASITLVVGATVGITGTRPPAHATLAERPAIIAPTVAQPTANATPAAPSPPTAQAATPAAATPVPLPPPTPVPVHAPPPPVSVGPVTFTPFPVPTAQVTPAPSPTPSCLLGIIC